MPYHCHGTDYVLTMNLHRHHDEYLMQYKLLLRRFKAMVNSVEFTVQSTPMSRRGEGEGSEGSALTVAFLQGCVPISKLF